MRSVRQLSSTAGRPGAGAIGHCAEAQRAIHAQIQAGIDAGIDKAQLRLGAVLAGEPAAEPVVQQQALAVRVHRIAHEHETVVLHVKGRGREFGKLDESRNLGIRQAVVHSEHGDDPRMLNTAWTMQIVRGLLGSSILGFHTRYHCKNFLETVDRSLEARIEHEHSGVTFQGEETLVESYPISIAWPFDM